MRFWWVTAVCACSFGGDLNPADAPVGDVGGGSGADSTVSAVDGMADARIGFVIDGFFPDGPADAPVDARPCVGGDVTISDPLTGHCYLVFNSARQWQAAADFCTGMSMHLVTISSTEENALVRPSSGFRWIGLEDTGSEGSFTWVTGEPLTFTNWNGGEPNGGGDENCGGMLNNGRWNDFQCSDAWPLVCEFP